MINTNIVKFVSVILHMGKFGIQVQSKGCGKEKCVFLKWNTHYLSQ